MKKLMALAAALVLSATVEAASAQFAYQGVLKDSGNAPLSGTTQVEIRLYDVDNGGSALWGRTYAVQLDGNGLFNIEVSDSTGSPAVDAPSTSLDTVFATADTIYIGIKVKGSSGEVTPRQKLLPVPFAAVAANVVRASGDFTVAGKLTATSAEFSGALTATSLNVGGPVTTGALTANGGATITGDLTVGGKISGFGTVPIGGIIMWSGTKAQIPVGWVLCDGQNNTPNLCDKFVLGAGGRYGVTAQGGAETVALTLAQIPNHSHIYKFKGGDVAGIKGDGNVFYDVSGKLGKTTNTGYTEAVGSGAAHENMPPYYALCFIMRKN